MTENNNENQGALYAAPPNRLLLTDGSQWGSEEITDLRAKYVEVEADRDNARTSLREKIRQWTTLANSVRDRFRELVDDEYLDVDHANEALDDLGLEKLAVEYEWNATVELRGYGKAPDEDALHSAIEGASYTIEAYEDGVEDVEVDEASVTIVSSDRVR